MIKNIQEIYSGKHKLKNIPENSVAIIASAIRTERWMETYEFLKRTNETPFIMIFSGHIRPEYKLPDNFYYVYSTMNAAGCCEVCLRLAHCIPEVKYIINIADDCLWPEKLLDTLVAAHESDPLEDVMIAPAFWGDVNAKETGELTNTYHAHDPDSPTLCVAGMAKKTTSIKIGGCDRAMRLHELGGNVRSIGDLPVREIEPWNNSHILGPTCYSYDRPLLDWLWTTNRVGGDVSFYRLDPLQPYEAEDLQGEVWINE